MIRIRMTIVIVAAMAMTVTFGVMAQTKRQMEEIQKLKDQTQVAPPMQPGAIPPPQDFRSTPCLNIGCAKPGTPEYDAFRKQMDELRKKNMEKLPRFDQRDPRLGPVPARRGAAKATREAKAAAPSGVTYGAAKAATADTMRAREQLTQSEPPPVERKAAPGAVADQKRPDCAIRPVMTDAEISACR